MSDTTEEESMKFEVLKAVAGDGPTARLGRLTLPTRPVLQTPNFLAITSRGVVPHLTPDTITRHGSFSGAYMAMEDLVEKSQKNVTKIPAVAKMPCYDGKRLHAFTCLPASVATILGPRRVPAVKAPIGNNDSSIQVFSSNGFQPLTNKAYIDLIATLKPDIAIPLADLAYSSTAASKKQGKGIVKMCERTEEWMEQLHKSLDSDELPASNTAIFAPTLPAPLPLQWHYLSRLSEDFLDKLSGLAVYDTSILPELERYPPLLPLPRLTLDAPSTPHDILRQISLGVDVFLLPFVNAVSDAGVAMSFQFPPPSPSPKSSPNDASILTTTTSLSSSPPPPQTTTTTNSTELLPLGTDLTFPANAASLDPLVPNCACHTCTAHHRAYIHHLLNAREMLAWTLLQLHNHHTMAQFFSGVRASLATSKAQFEQDCALFFKTYEPELPIGSGTRPRARGYHFKSELGDEKRNVVTWQLLQEGQQQAKTTQGKENFKALQGKVARDEADTPVVPGDDVDAAELVREGLGQVVIKSD
ncbi:tRNA-guanine(15) transglycosylase-like protein [Coniella lustricola]|uniref:Queuine tRNA-ribosyltransferase accessory subunit 2 n=1 Tax=Coniella lustricola TaxID=2025994 RepID=A0A2T3A8V9_9PEZI|nr:tRNA-guanine(15) transglycosylase-like protein [Coniella lustricola]